MGKGTSQHRLDGGHQLSQHTRWERGPRREQAAPGRASTSSSPRSPRGQTGPWGGSARGLPCRARRLGPAPSSTRDDPVQLAFAFHVLLPFKVMTKSSRKMATWLVLVPETELLFIVLNYSVCV